MSSVTFTAQVHKRGLFFPTGRKQSVLYVVCASPALSPTPWHRQERVRLLSLGSKEVERDG